MQKKCVILVGILLLVTGYIITKNQVDAIVKQRQREHDIRFIPKASITQKLSLGFNEAVADYFWIEALNYFGGQLLNKNRDYKYLRDYCQNILKLDPLFTLFYDWAATSFIYNGMPISEEFLRESISFVNLGIENLQKVHRYDSTIILKGAFNYAIEALDFKHALPYFRMAGHSFSDQRNALLVASTYASYAQMPELVTQYKLEYLGHIAFEAKEKSELIEAIQILSSPRFNSDSSSFVRSLRVKLETDADIQEVVKTRLQSNPIMVSKDGREEELLRDTKTENLLGVDISRTWLPAEMLVIFSL